jgi:hypothetical protein
MDIIKEMYSKHWFFAESNSFSKNLIDPVAFYRFTPMLPYCWQASVLISRTGFIHQMPGSGF